jgi:hypothetical protein
MACEILSTLCKSPTEVLDYQFDWSTYLDAETIVTSSWAVPAGITEDSDSKTATTTTVWLSGGTLAATYTITNTITTSAATPRTVVRSILVHLATR